MTTFNLNITKKSFFLKIEGCNAYYDYCSFGIMLTALWVACEQVYVPQGIKGFINIAFAPRSVCIVLGVACDSHISFILFSWSFDDRR